MDKCVLVGVWDSCQAGLKWAACSTHRRTVYWRTCDPQPETCEGGALALNIACGEVPDQPRPVVLPDTEMELQQVQNVLDARREEEICSRCQLGTINLNTDYDGEGKHVCSTCLRGEIDRLKGDISALVDSVSTTGRELTWAKSALLDVRAALFGVGECPFVLVTLTGKLPSAAHFGGHIANTALAQAGPPVADEWTGFCENLYYGRIKPPGMDAPWVPAGRSVLLEE